MPPDEPGGGDEGNGGNRDAPPVRVGQAGALALVRLTMMIMIMIMIMIMMMMMLMMMGGSSVAAFGPASVVSVSKRSEADI